VAKSREVTKANNTCVSCPICSCEISLDSAQRLPGEFSVLCPNCGQRKNHKSVEAHDRKEQAETTHPLRAIQFGKRTAYLSN
jgi:hypothetical protein